MARGSGSVYKQKKRFCTSCNTWWRQSCAAVEHPSERRPVGTWMLKYYREGRPFRESTELLSITEAKKLLALRTAAHAQGVPVTPKHTKVLFDELANDAVTDYEVSGKRATDDFRRRLDLHLRPYFRGRRAASINTATVREYCAARQKGHHRVPSGAARADC